MLQKTLCVLASVLVACALAFSNTTFIADLKSIPQPFPHLWQRMCGSCHATTALRADWQAQLITAHKAIGFSFVRFHGIFDDDMSVLRDDGTFAWFNVDQIMDFLLDIRMRPYVELSFMPEKMASVNCTQTQFHYKANVCPPQDWDKWAELVTSFTRHMVSRYGLDEVSTWYFEIWNEPNLGCFWAGTQEQYFTLAKYTYRAVKSVSPLLRVGGPSTAQSQWLREFIHAMADEGITMDFISTHEYPSDPNSPPNRDNMKTVFTQARADVGSATMPIFYSEFNSGLDEPHHDDPFAAAFLVKAVLDSQGIIDLMSYWTFTDIFEEGGQNPEPFSQQFGLQTIHGIPKPAFRAFEFLSWTGDTNLPTKVRGDYNTVDVLVSQNATHLNVIFTNYNWVKQPIKTETVDIMIYDFPVELQPPIFYKQIRDGWADPRARWEEMGKPTYPTELQLNTLMKASKVLEVNDYPYVTSKPDNAIIITVTIVPYSVISLGIPLA